MARVNGHNLLSAMLPVLVLAIITLLAACASAGSESASSPSTPPPPGPKPTVTPAPIAIATAVPAVTPAPRATAETGPAPTVARPNIIVFMTDDQTVEGMVALPAVQALIFDTGMSFDNSVVNLPVCCPSRATFLTGQHAANHGVLSNSGVNGGFQNFENQDHTIATALQDVGYHTIHVGKYLNGFGFLPPQRYTPPGWSNFQGYMAPTEVLYHSTAVWANGEIKTWGPDTQANDLLTTIMIDSLDRAPADQPIFAWANYPAPHAQAGTPLGQFRSRDRSPGALNPPIPADRHAGAFAEATLPSRPNLGQTAGKPEFLARPPADIVQAEAFYQAVLESLLSVDESVAAIIEHIENLDSDRETWFMFTSDNGLLLGEHGVYGGKYLPYEETVRVPLAISGPGVIAGTTQSVVSNVDLAPTIVDIAGAEAPRDFDGRSLLPLLTGTDATTGRAVLIEGFEFRRASPPYRAVHTGDSVYIEWRTGYQELYDLAVDPYQLVNLAVGPTTDPELLERNQALLGELVGCAGAECREVGSELPVPGLPFDR